MQAKGLGKGFGSLLPQDFDQSILLDKQDRVQKITIDQIEADPQQPRKLFDQQAIDELATSIKRYGILQPLVVTQHGQKYRIVAGERRFRAAQKAGLTSVPVLVRTLKELERLEISLIENVQRVDLDPVEQALSIAKLHEQFNLDYEAIAKRLGKAKTTIVNIVRLLQLPDFARDALQRKVISEGHARAVLSLKDQPELQKQLVKEIEQKELSVRAAEQFVKAHKTGIEQKSKPLKMALNKDLSKRLSTKWHSTVKVKTGSKGGTVTLSFTNKAQLEQFLKVIS